MTTATERPHDASALDVLAFEAVSLDELVGEAELLSRVDRKYLVPVDVAAQAMEELDASTGSAAPRSRVLEIDGQRDFAYDSVYFDTEDRLAYQLTAQRRRRRFKLRTRSYLDTGACFLEVKTKSGRGATVKQRLPYEACDRARITQRGREFCFETLGEQGHEPELLDRLSPVLTSRYRRATVLMPEGARATFDTGLQWISGRRRLVLPGRAIIETKSHGGASALDRALWRRGYRPSGISKFGTGTAALHPDLPSNKWARVLREAFATAQITKTHNPS